MQTLLRGIQSKRLSSSTVTSQVLEAGANEVFLLLLHLLCERDNTVREYSLLVDKARR
jgi:hypothetical protein